MKKSLKTFKHVFFIFLPLRRFTNGKVYGVVPMSFHRPVLQIVQVDNLKQADSIYSEIG